MLHRAVSLLSPMSFESPFAPFFDDVFFDSFVAMPRRPVLAPSAVRPPHPVGSQLQCRAVDKGVVLELEVPRFRQEHITVEADPASGTLVVTGRRGTGSDREAGNFRRAFKVPRDTYDLAKLESAVADGVLTIRLPELPRPVPTPLRRPRSRSEPHHDEDVAVERTAAAAAEADPAKTKEAERGAVAEAHPQQQLFEWPPRMEVAAKTETTPLTYTITMPAGVTGAPQVSLKIRDGTHLVVDVSYTSRTESEHGFSEQSGSFCRTFPLPEGTTKDHVAAKMEGAKLVITVRPPGPQ